ncbi:MAG: hypothetical protein K6F63_00165 [Lachnospiraceae bacterium]|nr:hypothetical protein [Lachnospiraceae bacterium]
MRDRYYFKLIGFGLLHFLTDFMCHFYAFRYVKSELGADVFTVFLAYNFVAFALQCPIGFFFDKMDRRISKEVAIAAGALLIISGYGIRIEAAAVTAGLLLCALGNACLHVAGSQGVIREGKKGLSGGGVFIAFGALGVGLGDYYGLNGIKHQYAFVGLLIFLIVATIFVVKIILKVRKTELKTNKNLISLDKESMICLFMCLIAVFIRSYVGFLLPKGFNELITGNAAENVSLFKAMLPNIVGFIGKAMGGIVVSLLMIAVGGKDLRKLNYIYGISALMASTLLLGAFGDVPACVFIGNLFFHSLMPVTYYEIFCILPQTPGFSLGYTTLALFAGMIPALAITPPAEYRTILIAIFNVLGAVGLALAFKMYLNRGKGEKGIKCKST